MFFQQGNFLNKSNNHETNVIKDNEITITFISSSSKYCKDIKMKAGEMVAILINEYYVKTKNEGPFYYRGKRLSPEDCTTLLEIGMKNGDIIFVGKSNYY